MSKKDDKEEPFDWINLKKQLEVSSDGKTVHPEHEPTWEKFKRRFKENPLIPIGCGLTTLCLTVGIFAFGRRNSRLSQLMMRGRVIAQGGTIFALLAGLLYNANTKKPVTSTQPNAASK